MTTRPDRPRCIEPRWLPAGDAAFYLRVSETKFRDWVERKLMPEPVTVDGCVRWDRWKLDAAIDALSDQQDSRWREPVA